MKRIALLALPNCLHSSVSGFHDILAVAGRPGGRETGVHHHSPFDPVIVTPDGRPVSCFGGLSLTPETALDHCGPLDLIYIPVVYGNIDPILSHRRLLDTLCSCHDRGTLMTAVCAGVFVLAQTGILDNRDATTHWDLAADFSDRFPKVRLKPERMLVDGGDVVTAGGVTAYMDLALYLIARFASRKLAAMVSRSLLIDPVRRSQAPYTRHRASRSHGDLEIRSLQDWMEGHFQEPITTALLSHRAGLGERTLARRFKKATGDTPLAYLQHLRLDAARTLLETSASPVDQITWEVGYQDASSFRRLFRERTGLAPTAYRKRFSLIVPGG